MLILQSLSALCITLALLLGCAWVFKTYGARWGLSLQANNKRIQVLEKTTLTAHTTLHLVKVDDTEHLLATTAAQTTIISSTKAKKSGKVGA